MNEYPTERDVSNASRHDAPEHVTSRHSLTINKASDRFSELGVPRSPRSVQRFCEQGNLDAILINTGKTERYFIDPQSVDRYAEELRQLDKLAQFASTDSDTSRQDVPQRDTTRPDAPAPVVSIIAEPIIEPDHEAEELRTRIDTLEKENFQLQIDRAAKEQVIGHMVDERRHFVDQLTTLSRENGRLEMQVLQLAAPAADVSRHDASEVVAVVVEPEAEQEIEVTAPAEPQTVPSTPAEKPRKWWHL
jgi:hypothetical protein